MTTIVSRSKRLPTKVLESNNFHNVQSKTRRNSYRASLYCEK